MSEPYTSTLITSLLRWQAQEATQEAVTEIVLPWPPRELSPNARPHHMQRARATKSYRETAHWIAKIAHVSAPEGRGDIAIHVTFNPPSRRGDRQNFPGHIKAGIDGIADAMGVNDRRFNPEYTYGEPVKNGRVTVRIMPACGAKSFV